MHITETNWWNDMMHGIYGPRKGGARIIIDAENAATGAGKTGLAVYLARLLSRVFGYEFCEEDMTLSGGHYLDRWREHPGAEQPSVLILDELAAAGAGNSRRSMSTQNVELGSAWQLMRKKRIVSLVTLPHWSRADKTMRQQADYRLWCRERPIGFFQPYSVGATFDDGSISTSAYDDVDRIQFPDMDSEGDEFYEMLSGQKDELLDSEYFDADRLRDPEDDEDNLTPEEAARQEKIKIAQRKRESGDTAREIAKDVDMSHTWVLENTENTAEM